MDKKRTGNIGTCIISGNQFLEVAEELTTNDICDVNRVRPFFVNAGLASELFLKAIQMYEHGDGTFSGGHNLVELFDGISKSARDSIYLCYNAMYAEKSHKVKLDSLLSNYPCPFIKFRYTFESPAEGNVCALLYFARSLRHYIEVNIENRESIATRG